MKDLDQILDQAIEKFKTINQESWESKTNPKKWSKKEILGHLVDSARNNLQRFIEIQYDDGPYQLIPYKQDNQVAANNYQDAPFIQIENLWISLNRHISYIIGIQSDEQLSYEVFLDDGTETNLEWLMQDYIDHLEHHLRQILS